MKIKTSSIFELGNIFNPFAYKKLYQTNQTGNLDSLMESKTVGDPDS